MERTVDGSTRREGVEAVDRALAILSAFGEDATALSLAELARRTGLYKSMILRMAASLGAKSYLVRESNGTFRLGPEVWRLGSLYRRGFDLGEYVRPILRQVVERTGETACFYVRDGSDRLGLYRLNSPKAARHHLDEGVRLPLDRGAGGRVLLAYSDPGRGDNNVRAAGFAISRGERDPDVGAAAVPVFDRRRQLRGALSVSTLLTRLTPTAELQFLEVLRETAGALGDTIPL
jgi:DNA-binding IclR family transcriptional regulator